MRLITILNHVVNYKRFVVKTAKNVESDSGKSEIEFGIAARKNSKPVCSGCLPVLCDSSQPGIDTHRQDFQQKCYPPQEGSCRCRGGQYLPAA